MDCQCEVCQALTGLHPEDATPEVLRQLPESVRRILAAQERVRAHYPLQGDEALVKAAAQRCRAGRFRPLPRVIH